MNRKWMGIVLSSVLAACSAFATSWNQDVLVGATWSDGTNWDEGVPPAITNLALFNNTQANTYVVNVDVAGVTRLMQVSQPHTFNGAGSINITTAPTAHFQPSMYNTTTTNVTYNVPVNITTTTGYYGQSQNLNNGTTLFNDAFTLTSGSSLNLDKGVHAFNGDLTIDGTLRLGSGSTIIGGSGTTSIGGSGYILTAGTGTELHLNRAGAYTVANTSTGYLRVEKTKVYFNVAQALGAGTNVKMYEVDGASALVSGGDYDQDFGYLELGGSGGTFDMQNSACVWTFADSSARAWVKLDIDNFDVTNTIIRFAISGGTGLTDTQIEKISVNDSFLTLADTTVAGGYLYLTPQNLTPDVIIWKENVATGATWSVGTNWEGDVVPLASDIVSFENAQAYTYTVDVDTAAEVRLLEVSQPHTFDGSGSIGVTATAGELFEPCMLNGYGGTVTYNVPFSITVNSSDSTYYGNVKNTFSLSTTVFTNAFTLEAGTGKGINLDGVGAVEFNGDLTLNDTLRIGAGSMVIGGSGTTSIGGAGYILTSGTGTKLYLNRTGAYTVADPLTGYLRVERSKVYFNAPYAVEPGTLVRMFETDPTSALVSGGDYDQEFGKLYCSSTVNDAIIDMQNSACVWTFADCSDLGWGAPGIGLSVTNVHLSNTVVRFKIDIGGTGLTQTQIERTKVNGVALTPADVTVEGEYLYITPALSVPLPPIEEPSIVGSSLVAGDIMKIVVDAPSTTDRYWPVWSDNLVIGSWTNVAHSDDGVHAFVVTNLDYSTMEESNAVIIYVQADDAAGFFRIKGE